MFYCPLNNLNSQYRAVHQRALEGASILSQIGMATKTKLELINLIQCAHLCAPSFF